MYKVCAGCKEKKLVGHFYAATKSRNKYSSYCKICSRAKVRKYKKPRREECLLAMGGACVQCGFSDFRGLQIDHINGDGYKDPLGRSTNQYYDYVVSHPESYQLLCANCNAIKRITNEEHARPRLPDPVSEYSADLPSYAHADKTHCLRGHELSDDNLWISPKGSRNCLKCRGVRRMQKLNSASEEELAEFRAKWAEDARNLRRKNADYEIIDNKDKTHCPKGHAFSGENLRITPRGSRKCRECEREHLRLSRQRAREKRKQKESN
jgi:hypothetical protein